MHTTSRSARPGRPVLVGLAVLLTLAVLVAVAALAGRGSSGDSPGAGGSADRAVGVRPPAAVAPEAPADSDDGAEAAALDAAPVSGSSAGAGQTTAERPAIIATGTVALEAEDVAQARLQVRKIVDAHQGTLDEQETTTGDEGRLTTARLVLRVPSDRFDDVVAALEQVATPTGTTTNGQDVSAEVVDIEARIRAQRKSVARIEALLARAESIQQIVAVEAQLATRQADLDALEGRQRWLADQTSMSTVTVYVERPAEREKADDTTDGFLGGLERGWDAFVDGIGVVVLVIGFLLPWLVLLALLAGPAWLAIRRRRPRAARPAETA